ncbi:MAG: hypothetical protein LAT84_13770 [Balneolia bacterium]|nr:hypothetical protein [Balneolia bacterium]
MNHLTFVVFFTILFFVHSQCLAQNTVERAEIFAPQIDVVDSLVIKGANKHIRALSTGSANGTIGGNDVEFKIPISEDTYLASLFLAETDSTLIFLYEESITTHSSTHFVIYGKQQMNLITKEDIYAFYFERTLL